MLRVYRHTSTSYKSLIDMLCSILIDCCLQSGYETLPHYHITYASEHSPRTELFRVGLMKSNMPVSNLYFGIGFGLRLVGLLGGTLYEGMKRARHKYHYAVRRLRKNKLQL